MTKNDLRKLLRAKRRDHVAALTDSMRTLVFMRPPAPLIGMIPDDAAIGLYHAGSSEAPTASYARHFFEQGHEISLPHFSAMNTRMQFRRFMDPHDESDLETGPFGIRQPKDTTEEVVPTVLFVPLVGFTKTGARLGQGGGHYDRWLAAHPGTITIGLGWDCQLVEDLPTEPHDIPLCAIVTPTRLYGPFA